MKKLKQNKIYYKYKMSWSQFRMERKFKPIKPNYNNVSVSVIKPTPIEIPTDVFPIIIKTMTGKYIPVYIHNKMTIHEVKLEIDKIENIQPEQQRLIINGKELQDNHLVHSYHLCENDIIHIVLRLRGGMFHQTSARCDFDSLSNITHLEELIEKHQQFLKLNQYELNENETNEEVEEDEKVDDEELEKNLENLEKNFQHGKLYLLDEIEKCNYERRKSNREST